MSRRRPLAALAVQLGALFLALVVVSDAAGLWGPHISDLNVLLPPRMKNTVEHRLIGSAGCFSWFWDHHDVLSVEPEYNTSSQCSTSARLISIAPYSGRRETSVHATDILSGTTVHCKVIIDKISRIQIFHHALKIDLDELVTLQIRAFDYEENVFSSLTGLHFLWQHSPSSSKHNSIQHLLHVPLKETPLSDCGGFCSDLDRRIKIEDRGLGSDLYVVKGIEIGQEVVRSQLHEEQVENVFDLITLTVAEAISLHPPSPVMVMIGAIMQYELRAIHLNNVRAINLPSAHHKWYATNSSVASISHLGVVHALDLGLTDIVVEDTRIPGHMQTSSLHVVVPHRISLHLVPINGSTPLQRATDASSSIWHVFPGQDYIVQVKVFSEGSIVEMHITEKNDLKLESNTFEYWDLLPASEFNGAATTYDQRSSSKLLRPIREGKGFISASISYQSGCSSAMEVLNVIQEIDVCPKVKLVFDKDIGPNILRLPWSPSIFQELPLRPSGGCGGKLDDFMWHSSNENIVSVSAKGVVSGKIPGKAIVRLVCSIDFLNYDEVVVEVSVPSSMVIIPTFPVEVVIGSQIQAVAALRTSDGKHYTKCDALNALVRWQVISEKESFKIIDNTRETLEVPTEPHVQLGYPCSWISVNAFAAGGAILVGTLSYDSDISYESSGGSHILKAACPISSYYPLVIHQARDGNPFGGYWINTSDSDSIQDCDGMRLDELYLAPGTTMDVIAFGGPQRWDEGVEFIETVDVLGSSDNSSSNSEMVDRLDGNVYRISCAVKGAFKLIFSRGNLVGVDHPIPAIAHAGLSLLCDFPSSISLITNEPVNTFHVLSAVYKASRGPRRLQTSPIVVSNGQTIRLAAVGIHVAEKYFANSSSLWLRWELIGCKELAYWDGTHDSESIEEKQWEKFLVLMNSTGMCTVRATMSPRQKLAANVFEEFHGEESDLTDAAMLEIVSSLHVSPEFVLLFFDQKAKANLTISGGTCFLEAFTNDTNVVEIIEYPGKRLCSHLVVRALRLGTALITVHDNGLSPRAVTSSVVRVATADWITIISTEHVNLVEGTIEEFEISAGTSNGDIFPASQYMFMDVRVHIDGDMLELVNIACGLRIRGCSMNGPKLSVKAVNSGITSIYVSANNQLGQRLLSQVVEVEVYKPLRVYPEYIFLVPGVSYTLTAVGGPKTGSFIVYTSFHERILKVHNSTGKLFADSPGNATVRAVVYTDEGVIICEAMGNVEVGIPDAMALNFQSDRLCVGCSMPIFLSSPAGDLFSFHEVCQRYSWTTENIKVLQFQKDNSLSYSSGGESSHLIKTKSAISQEGANAFVKSVIGRSPGNTKITVSVFCHFISSAISRRIVYNASKSIMVVPDPPLGFGIPATWILPPFYMTSELLVQSSDLDVPFSHHNRETTVSYSLLQACGKSDSSRKDVIAIVGSNIRTGESNEIACVQTKDEASGRVEVALCVRVAEVVQVRVSAAKSFQHVIYLALNARIELYVHYGDELGYIFREAHGVVPLEVETNHPDVLSVLPKDAKQGGSDFIVLQAKKLGTALVRVRIYHSKRKADYIMVSVGATVHPSNPAVHVGHYVNFTVRGDAVNVPQTGYWLSGNESVISVNRNSGEAHALCEGIAEVIFLGSDMKLQTQVAVLRVSAVTIEAPPDIITNIAFPSDGYKFLVRFSYPSKDGPGAINMFVDPQFDCTVEPSFIGYAKPWSDLIMKKSYCLFFPYSPKQLINNFSKSKFKPELGSQSDEYEGFMPISIQASLQDGQNITASTSTMFVGGFSVSPSKLNLSPNNCKGVITIFGNTAAKLSWNAKDLLLVHSVKIEASGISGHIDYQVEVVGNQPFREKLIIVLPSTGQNEELEIIYNVGVNVQPTRTAIITWPAILVCIAVLVITVFIFLKLLDKPYRLIPNAQGTATSNISHDASPLRSIQSSPQTPPALLEYTRRTIDETPYLKRDPRRRYNPQYTY